MSIRKEPAAKIQDKPLAAGVRGLGHSPRLRPGGPAAGPRSGGIGGAAA